jgi:hypothetical protein
VQHAAHPVCYYGGPPAMVYENLGHAEVTQVTLRGSEQQQNEQVLPTRGLAPPDVRRPGRKPSTEG